MESLQNIKRRIKGVKNINQITKAMELVAATKMRRSQEIALASRPYAYAALDLLAVLARRSDLHPTSLLEKRPVAHTLIVLIASDKGLAGSFNSSVLRAFEALLKENGIDINDDAYSYVGVGQKAVAYLERRTPRLVGSFVRFGDFTTVEEIEGLTKLLIDGYVDGRWDKVIAVSTHFKTALRQVVLKRQILPVDPELLEETAEEIVPETGRFAELIKERHVSFFNREKDAPEYLIEPSAQDVLEALVPHLVEMQLYHIVLEANASEHAARRAAMKSASDNAGELASKLSVQYNKSRQASITKELTEITAGAESLK